MHRTWYVPDAIPATVTRSPQPGTMYTGRTIALRDGTTIRVGGAGGYHALGAGPGIYSADEQLAAAERGETAAPLVMPAHQGPSLWDRARLALMDISEAIGKKPTRTLAKKPPSFFTPTNIAIGGAVAVGLWFLSKRK